MQPPNSQHVVQVLWHNKARAKQRDNARCKSFAGYTRCARRSDFQIPAQISGKRQHEHRCKGNPTSRQPIMAGIVARREKVRDNAITPVVILWERPCAHAKRPEKRKKDECQQRGQDGFAIKHRVKGRTHKRRRNSTSRARLRVRGVNNRKRFTIVSSSD